MKAATTNRTRRFGRLLAGALTATAILAVHPASATTGFDEWASAPFQNSNQFEDCTSHLNTADCSAHARVDVSDGSMKAVSGVRSNDKGLAPGWGFSNGTAEIWQNFYVEEPVSNVRVTATFALDSASVHSSIPAVANTGRDGFVQLRLDAGCDGDCFGDSTLDLATILSGNTRLGSETYSVETDIANSDGSPIQGSIWVAFDLTAYSNIGQLGVGSVDATARGHLLSIEAHSI